MPRRHAATPGRRQQGGAALEMALALPAFMLVLLFLFELCRVMYLFLTLQEVTRQAARAASVARFDDAAAMAAVRQRAMFGTGAAIPLSGGIDVTYLRIDYFSLGPGNVLTPVNVASLNPDTNVSVCAANANAPACIRFVQASICQPGAAACASLPYTPLTVLAAPFFTTLRIPTSTTLTPAESLGARPPCGLC